MRAPQEIFFASTREIISETAIEGDKVPGRKEILAYLQGRTLWQL